MLAADGRCRKDNALLIQALLDGGASSSAAERNRNGKTAADIAAARNAHAVSQRLRALESKAQSKETFSRCAVCAAKLRRRSKLEFLHDKIKRGEETNPLCAEMFSADSVSIELVKPEFHRINSCINFRKEVTESMALISELKKMLVHEAEESEQLSVAVGTAPADKAESFENLHIIDLCCGASLTSALALQIFPGSSVTALDLVDAKNLPHYKEAGLGDRFAYIQGDLHDDGVIAALQNRISARKAEHVVVFGAHLCGVLSIRAIEIFEQIQARHVLLMPCCLPSKQQTMAADPREITVDANKRASESSNIKVVANRWQIPTEIFSVSDQEMQYRRWASALADRMQNSSDTVATKKPRTEKEGTEEGSVRIDTAVVIREVTDVLSKKNVLIAGTRVKK
jgi:hypothetical protein